MFAPPQPPTVSNPNHRRVGEYIVHPPWWLTNAAAGITPKGDTEDVIVSYIPSWVTAHISLSRYLDIAGNLTTLKASLRSGSQYVKDLNGSPTGNRNRISPLGEERSIRWAMGLGCHPTLFRFKKRSILLKSYHMVLFHRANIISAWSLSVSKNLSEHPRYAIASAFDSHIFWIGSTFPVFLSRAILFIFLLRFLYKISWPFLL